MALKEFSDTYGVPYNIVFKISYQVKPVATEKRNKDFPEKELIEKTLEYYSNKRGLACDILSETESMSQVVRKVAKARDVYYD